MTGQTIATEATSPAVLRSWLSGKRLGVIVLIIAVLLVPIATDEPYFRNIAILALMWGVAATGWNLLGGYGGQFSFGHAAFFGTGAYTFALLYSRLGVPAGICLLAAGLVAGLLYIPASLLFFRLRGPYFALSMLALAEVMRLVGQNWVSLTRGAGGLLLKAPYVDQMFAYYLIGGIGIAAVLLTWWIASSKLGYYLLAIREDQDVAMTLGIDIMRYKVLGFAISGFLAGIAGGFYAGYLGYLEPNVVYSGLEISLPLVLMSILGGYGTILGPMLGSFLLTIAHEIFRTYLGNTNVLIYGVLIILVILFMQDGIVGALRGIVRRRRPAAEPAETVRT